MGFDLVIRNGTIADGTGKKLFRNDVGIKKGKIVCIGSIPSDVETTQSIEATGMIICPGFVDSHSHSDYNVLAGLDGVNMLRQGITTEITGHCGYSIAPYADFNTELLKEFSPEDKRSFIKENADSFTAFLGRLNKWEMPTNMAMYVGQGTIRAHVMGYENREPNPREFERMKEIFAGAMEAGALGLTTGLVYSPGSVTAEWEIIELCKIAAMYKGGYTSHMRSYSDGVLEAVDETMRVGQLTGIPVEISHFNVSDKINWGKGYVALDKIDNANKEGISVRINHILNDSKTLPLLSLLPEEYANGKDTLNMLKEAEIRKTITKLLAGNSYNGYVKRCGFENIYVSHAAETKEYEGMSIREISEQTKISEYDALYDLLTANSGSVIAVCHTVCDDEMEAIIKSPYTTFGNDETYQRHDMKVIPNRTTDVFVELLNKYVMKKKLLTIEEAVHKMTYLAAANAGIKNKGLIQTDCDADVTVLDLDNISTSVDKANNHVAHTGVEYVIVNGIKAFEHGVCTGVKAGKAILK